MNQAGLSEVVAQRDAWWWGADSRGSRDGRLIAR